MRGRLFREFLAGIPGAADDLSESAVAHAGSVEDDGLELGEIDLAVGEDARVGALVHHFADQDAVRPADHLALEGQRVFVDDGSVDIGAGRHREAHFGDLVGHLVAAHHAEVVGLRHGAHVGEGDRERAGQLEVGRGLVLGEGDDDLVVVILAGPGGHHHVRVVVLVPGGDHHAGLRRCHQGMAGAEIRAARHFFQGLVAHGIGSWMVCITHFFISFVFLEVVLFAEGGLGQRVLVGEVVLPTRAEIDVPTPEAAEGRLGILVVVCAELAVLAGVGCLCHRKMGITSYRSVYFFSKGEDRADGHLEVLHAPGDAHDGDAEQQAEDQVEDGDLPPAEQDPDEVHHHRHAARLVGTVHQLMAERPEGVGPQFEKLDAKGDADDGDAQHEPHDVVNQGDDESAQDEPEDVAEELHGTKIRIIL